MPDKQNENYFCGREYCTGDHIDAGRYCHGNPDPAAPAQPVPPKKFLKPLPDEPTVRVQTINGVYDCETCRRCKMPILPITQCVCVSIPATPSPILTQPSAEPIDSYVAGVHDTDRKNWEPMSKSCGCRSADECPHKFAGVSQEEINQIVREDMEKLKRERAEAERPVLPVPPEIKRSWLPSYADMTPSEVLEHATELYESLSDREGTQSDRDAVSMLKMLAETWASSPAVAPTNVGIFADAVLLELPYHAVWKESTAEIRALLETKFKQFTAAPAVAGTSPNDPLPDITKVMGENGKDGKSAVYCKACELEAKDGIELGDFCHNCAAPAVSGNYSPTEKEYLRGVQETNAEWARVLSAIPALETLSIYSPRTVFEKLTAVAGRTQGDEPGEQNGSWNEGYECGVRDARAALRESAKEAPSDTHQACENAVREYFGYKKEVVLSAPGASRMVEIFERHLRSASPEAPAAPLGVCQNQIALHFQAASCVNWRPWTPSRKDSVCEAP